MSDDYFTISPTPVEADLAGVRTCRVLLTGEFDIDTRDELTTRLLSLVSPTDGTAPVDRIVVDLAEVRFIDSEALGGIIDGYQAAEQTGIDFRITNPAGIVKRLFEIIGLDHLLDPTPT
ncbi:STAS domain-containing protein [Actinoplanes sp. G11-F43]|uniref:STAS domain-containing protein n=1 Tax=Actinoplanes sp. G11-F43 TaxID=3424130 RepID=UPI003D34BAC1